MAEEAARVVRIERTFEAPAEDVFDAWTNPEVIRRWFIPRQGWREADADVDLRVGGTIRVVMHDSDGGPVGAGGEYIEIDRPRRLVMTWTFDDEPSNRQLIEIDFIERDGLTTVQFVNSDISDPDQRNAQYEGWTACFDEMKRVLASK